eukprot:TRINITY_DN4988_c0_g1_i1.p1 TRINITY_DN4988_c0_g1~~TRINITY_DN4988_c0_g1_i1.p1  ORF type:complete len:465 (-),score=148.35 TRINITY_DN4988_c0_g1_i1:10-1404(-)
MTEKNLGNSGNKNRSQGQEQGQGEEKRQLPNFIANAPWYVAQKNQGLDHQKFKGGSNQNPLDAWYDKGLIEEVMITKFRKGACTNCGAITHTAKFCCEKPKKISAKYSSKYFGKDEKMMEIQLGYEAKRDRWNGYNPSTYKANIEDWNALEEERKKRKAEELEKKLKEKSTEVKKEEAGEEAKNEEEDLDEARAKDDDVKTFANKDPRIKTTIRNLRIREDTAGYMYNLKEETGEPRDLRSNPYMDPKQLYLKNDNFVKSQDYEEFAQQEKFAEKAKEQANVELNTIAMPSQAELIYKNYKSKKELVRSKKHEELVAKYGGEEHLHLPEGLLESEIDSYQEFHPDGKIKKVTGKTLKKTKYEEDVFINNHTGVWGSYYDDDLGWGYACCLSHEKLSTCKGEEGKREQLKRNIERQQAGAKKEASTIQGGIIMKFSLRDVLLRICLLYTSPSPRDATLSRMPSSA